MARVNSEVRKRYTDNMNIKEENNDYIPPEREGWLPRILLSVIVLLIITLPVLIIKLNVGGFGEKVRPILGDIPYIQKILPAKPDPEDPKYMSRTELTQNFLRYKEQYNGLTVEADNLRRELEQLENIKDNYEQFLKDQEKLVQDKIELHNQAQELEDERTRFFEEIKDSDVEAYREYYEKINEDKAQQLYEQIIREEKADKKTKEYVAYYENMDSDDAARIFNEMSKTQLDLVVRIFRYMNKENAAEILASMTPTIASNISIKLSEQYLD